MADMRWIEILRKANSRQRTRLKNLILDSVKYYGAKWKKKAKNPDAGYELVELDPHAKKLVKEFSGLPFVGFATQILYMKEKGSVEHLFAEWEHPCGTPNLLFKHPEYPIFMIIGPGLRLNKSVLEEIDANEYNEDTIGITG